MIDPTETDPWKKVHPVSLYPDGNEYFSHTGAYYDRNAVDAARASDAAALNLMTIRDAALRKIIADTSAERNELAALCDSLKAERDAARQAHDDARMELTEADYFLGSLKAEHAALKASIQASVKSMRADCHRLKFTPLASEVVPALTVDEWANELLAALSSSQAQEP